MKRTLLSILISTCLLNSCQLNHDNSWNLDKLKQAQEYSEQLGSFAFILYSNDSIVIAWGDTVTATELHSARKSISSSIYAIYEDQGLLNVDKTLDDVGIDDYPNPLSDLQKQAKIIHLIKSRSGINHTATAETESMTSLKTQMLGNSPNKPGTIWAYNNWDYNTLISIFEKETGIKEKDAFFNNIAQPLKMKDISDNTAVYHQDLNLSSHSSIAYSLSARDMLKFGQLCLNRGKWNGIQIIPENYFDKITSDYSETGWQNIRSGHGYMWWVPCDKEAKKMNIPKGTFFADGLGSQQIIIIPAWNTVMVHKTKTNYTEGFYMWLGQKGFSQSDSAYVLENLQGLQNEFLDFLVNKCKDSINIENPICENCMWVDDNDYLKLLEMIFSAKN